ncbi:MAG: hypothetical protein OEM39_00205 [Acidimicrobiia bacterium]|nr:hypothetical protein [Acidimicrobiia bacterium]
MRRLSVLMLLISSCAAPTPEKILADDFVSDAEYLAAIEAVGDCVEAAGADFSVEFDRNLTPSFSASGGENVGEVMDACIERHLGRVGLLWTDQHAPTSEDEAAFYDAVVSCVEEGLGMDFGTVKPESSGRGLDTSVTDAAIAADSDLYGRCFNLQLAKEDG